MGRPFNDNRNHSPCKGCEDRKLACSDHCSRYREWKAEWDQIESNRREYMGTRSADAKAARHRWGGKFQ